MVIEASTVPMLIVEEVDDHAMFVAFMASTKDAVVNYLTRMCGSREHGEELAQEAFVRIYQHRRRYFGRATLTPLLFRVATNLLRSEYRLARRREVLTKIFRRPEEVNGGRPDAELLQDETQRIVTAAISALPLHYRAPLILREIEGWSYEEIAQALACRSGTIKSRISRGRELLRAALAQYWNGGIGD
ncbi:MAG: RNA polymerase sigma factor [Acidobacteriota bacterium]